MKSSKKMIFFDIDGTLLPQGEMQVPESTKEALLMAKEKGNLTFINTGRTYFNIDPFIRDLNFDGHICGCGTYIYYHGRQLLASTIPHETCLHLIRLMRECKIPGFFEENTHIYFDTDIQAPNSQMLETTRRMFGTKAYDFPEDMNDPSFTFDKILAYVCPDSDIQTFRAKTDHFLEYIDRGNHVAEIIQKNYSKATGIEFMCSYLQIPLTSCYAVGDSTNDLSMLEYVPFSIAMGNSDPIVKEKCTYVTQGCRDDGIYNAMRYFGLI